jgi:hypothetical protein
MTELVMEKSKLTMRDANAKATFTLSDDTPTVVVGELIGIANNEVVRTGLTGDTVVGFNGAFELRRTVALKTDEGEVSTLRSKTLFLPIADHDALKTHLASGAVEFSARISVSRDAKAKGGQALSMSYVVTPLANDPLAKIRERHAAAVVAEAAAVAAAAKAEKGAKA